jgi:hypothetical protein
MSPAERRIVHTTLADNPLVQTQSSGQGEDRRVTVSLRPGAGGGRPYGGSTAPARGGPPRPSGGGRPPFRRNPQPAPPSARPIRRSNDFTRRDDQG